MSQQIIMFEDGGFRNLLPLVYWRAVFELRCGRDSLLDKLRKLYPDADISLSVRPELAELISARLGLPVNSEIKLNDDQVLMINGRYLADKPLPEIPVDSYIAVNGNVLMINISASRLSRSMGNCMAHTDGFGLLTDQLQCVTGQDDYKLIEYPWQLVHVNGGELLREWQEDDAEVLGTVCEGAYLINPSAIHIGKDSVIKPGAVLDASDGPIYIEQAVTISPNVTMLGPCFIGRESLIQPSAVIRQDTSIGPVCKAGGEIEASIMHGYSNKQHHGFLGHSYLGQWVNCGAGMTNSDLKNTYGPVRVPINGQYVNSGETFVGVMIGDHSKVGINTFFPTGAVIGFSCNIFTTNCPPSFVPSFSWITETEQKQFDAEKGVQIAQSVMARRNIELSAEERRLYLALPEIARRFEKPI